MKFVFAILVFVIWKPLSSQECSCESDSIGLDIGCDTLLFDNHTMLYWNYNCDSSWLTFKSPDGNRILYSLDKEIMEYTGQLGYAYFKEFKSVFLVGSETSSGCCTPMEFYLHDKTTGKLIKYLGEAIYTSEERNFPYVVSFTNSGYGDSLETDYNSLVIYNIETGKEAKMQLHQGDIEKAIESSGALYAQEIFEASEVSEGNIILKYVTKFGSNKKNTHKMIIIDIKNTVFEKNENTNIGAKVR